MSVLVKLGAAAPAWELDAAIVDLDGTMIDTLGDFVEALNCMLSDLQLPWLQAEEVEQMVGKGSEHLIRSALRHVLLGGGHPQQGLEEAVEGLFPQALQRYMQHYVTTNGRYAKVYDGVLDGLQALKKAGLVLACVTNKPQAFAQPLLAAKGLDGLFSVVFGGDAFARKKPDPLPLLKACEALGTAPARTLMLGDSSNDAQAARAAGCPVVLVTYGYNHGQPIEQVRADGRVSSIAQLHAH